MDLYVLKSEKKKCVYVWEKEKKIGKEKRIGRERERERERDYLIMKKEEIHGFDHADEE